MQLKSYQQRCWNGRCLRYEFITCPDMILIHYMSTLKYDIPYDIWYINTIWYPKHTYSYCINWKICFLKIDSFRAPSASPHKAALGWIQVTAPLLAFDAGSQSHYHPPLALAFKDAVSWSPLSLPALWLTVSLLRLFASHCPIWDCNLFPASSLTS